MSRLLSLCTPLNLGAFVATLNFWAKQRPYNIAGNSLCLGIPFLRYVACLAMDPTGAMSRAQTQIFNEKQKYFAVPNEHDDFVQNGIYSEEEYKYEDSWVKSGLY